MTDLEILNEEIASVRRDIAAIRAAAADGMASLDYKAIESLTVSLTRLLQARRNVVRDEREVEQLDLQIAILRGRSRPMAEA